MPRHPPNALLTLDRSHCQCPSFVVSVPCPSRLRSKGTETSHAANPKVRCNLQPYRDPLLRVRQGQSGEPEGCRTRRPDAQKVVRLFGQAIWTTKKCIGYFFDMFCKAKWLARKILQPSRQLAQGTRRAFPNISDQLLEMCPMTRGQATPIVMT